MSAGAWNEYDADDLGQEVAQTVSRMLRDRELLIRERDAHIDELERELAQAETRIEELEAQVHHLLTGIEETTAELEGRGRSYRADERELDREAA